MPSQIDPLCLSVKHEKSLYLQKCLLEVFYNGKSVADSVLPRSREHSVGFHPTPVPTVEIQTTPLQARDSSALLVIHRATSRM